MLPASGGLLAAGGAGSGFVFFDTCRGLICTGWLGLVLAFEAFELLEEFPVIFRANFRNGDMERESALPLSPLPLPGVAKYPFREVPDVLEPASLNAGS